MDTSSDFDGDGDGAQSRSSTTVWFAARFRHRCEHGRRGHPQRDRVSGDSEMTMIRTKSVFLFAAFAGAAFLVMGALVVGQASTGLNPEDLLKPLADSWPSYSGDYTGRRFSALTQVNQSNVRNLTLAWAARLTGGPGAGGFGPGSPASAARTIVGGEGSGDIAVAGATTVKGAVLMVNGVLYVPAPDNVWALDAHDGHELWHL